MNTQTFVDFPLLTFYAPNYSRVLQMTSHVFAVLLHRRVSLCLFVADPGVEHKHSGAGGFLQSDNWNQQHHRHQIN